MRLDFSDLCALWVIEHHLIFDFASSISYALSLLMARYRNMPHHFHDLIKLKSERSNLLSVT